MNEPRDRPDWRQPAPRNTWAALIEGILFQKIGEKGRRILKVVRLSVRQQLMRLSLLLHLLDWEPKRNQSDHSNDLKRNGGPRGPWTGHY